MRRATLIAASTLLFGIGVRAQAQGTVQLPAPTGPYAVGTRIAYLIDSTRADSEFPGGRPVTMQVWYPAAQRTGRTAPYLVEPGLRQALAQLQYYGIDSTLLDAWSALTTHSRIDAAPARGRFPLLIGSTGLGVIRANYTSIAEELASHGFIVTIVDSPYQGIMVLRDGRIVVDTLGRFEAPAAHRQAVGTWARDLSFTVDQLTKDDSFAPHVDTARIGALGHSTGGLVAVAACETDARFRACANMDGGLSAPDGEPIVDFAARGITKPALFLRSQPLYDDTTFARRGITREQWERQGVAGKRALEALVVRSPGVLWRLAIAGTGHMSFTDAPFVMPTTITRFGGRIIAPRRGWAIIAATLRAFFNGRFGLPGMSMRQLASATPEISLTAP